MILTYKYKLKGKRAVRQLRAYANACNFVWNFCVKTQKKTQRDWKSGKNMRWLSFYDFANLVAGTSKDLNLNAQTIQQICKQFVESRDTFKKCPKKRWAEGPKKKLGWIPFTNQKLQIKENSKIYLRNTFRWFGSKSRPLPDVGVKGGAFVEDSRGFWYVTFHVAVAELPKTGNGVIGIDLGLKTLATLSNGVVIENPKHLQKSAEKLATAQRAKNKKRTRALHAKIKNQRQDFLHKASLDLVREYDTIFVGDVSSSKLAKTKMAKSVLDAGWGTFKALLGYKASRHQVALKVVDERFSTVTCSACNARSGPQGQKGLRIREWVCLACGASHQRDVNAALNILATGLGSQPLVGENSSNIAGIEHDIYR